MLHGKILQILQVKDYNPDFFFFFWGGGGGGGR